MFWPILQSKLESGRGKTAAEHSGEYALDISRGTTLKELAAYLQENWMIRLAYTLFDQQGNLTAEFMLNGKPASGGDPVNDGDSVTVYPFLAGG